MALPNDSFDPNLISDSTLVNSTDDKVIAILQLLADMLGVDISSQRTVQEAFATFDATNGRWYEIIAKGAAANNGFVMKDADNDEQWRIRADGSGDSSLIVERWETDAYVEYFTITDEGLSFDGNTIGTITGVTAGDGLTGGGTSGTVEVSVDDGGIDTDMLADEAVTNAKVASDAAIAGSKIAAGSITPAKLDGSAGSGYVLVSDGTDAGWGSVGTAGIADGAVTDAKIDTGAVTNVKLASGAIKNTNISTSGGLSGQVLTHKGTSVEWDTPASGDGWDPVVARCYFTSPPTLIDSTTTYLEWDTEAYDTANIHSTVTNPDRFTVASASDAGYYWVNVQVTVDSYTVGASGNMSLLIAGSCDNAISVTSETASNRFCVQACGIVYISNGEYVRVGITLDAASGGSTDVTSSASKTFIDVFKIGE
jgi:hypothetical protein